MLGGDGVRLRDRPEAFPRVAARRGFRANRGRSSAGRLALCNRSPHRWPCADRDTGVDGDHPPHRWSVHGIDGPVRADVDVRIEPLDGNTRSRVTISLDFFGSGIGKLIVPLFVTPGAPREVAQSCETRKTHLDGVSAAD